MKLIIVIVRDSDNQPVMNALVAAKFRVTQISSTGGFLRRGSSTLLIGVEDTRVNAAMDVIRENLGPGTDDDRTRATLFVIAVDNYFQVL